MELLKPDGSAAPRGITRVTRNPRLGDVPNSPAAELWHYTSNYPFQIGPRQAAPSCLIQQSFRPGQDFLNGSDIIVFDDYRRIDTSKAMAMTRNEVVPNPRNGGKPCVLVKGPIVVGFVPLGAKRADGSPHPHAGTGFGWDVVAAWPVDDSDLVNEVQRKGRRQLRGSAAWEFLETYQFAYDGRQFRVTARGRKNFDEWVPGWIYGSEGFSSAIPDGDDLLMPNGMLRPGRPHNAGVCRWQRTNGEWKPVDYQPITPEDGSIEPTLVRDLDGEFLFCARATNASGHPMRVWRSSGRGSKWQMVLFVGGISAAPIVLHRGLDGTPYIAANRYQYQMHVKGRASVPYFRMPDGRPRRDGGTRECLMLWPLNDARDAVGIPVMIRDCLAEFGPPPHGTVWGADHAVGTVVQLADGRWHDLIGYRAYEKEENTEYTARTSHTGAYVEEVMAAGDPIPAWNF